MTRRQFTRSVLFGTGAMVMAPAFLRGQNLNSKLDIAIIGAGGRGAANTQALASENIVALCDVHERNLARAGEKHPGARRFADFRKLYDGRVGFDAVVVSTCEHTHAYATLPALRQKKHVYCEKPLTHNIWEARRIREAAAEAGVATQMGIQIHATENYRQVVELIQGGAIGPVREAHVWVSRAWGWQSEEAAQRNKDLVWVTERPKNPEPVPEGLDWDLWLGPALERPFHTVYFPGPKWYRWWDFGSGTMSDLGSHWNDLPFWALKLRAPKAVEAFGPPPNAEIAPASMSARYEYGAREGQPAVTLTWYQGELKPEIWNSGGIPKWDSGCLFIGKKGMLLANYSKHVLLPEKEFTDLERPAASIERSPGHQREWVQACKGGKRTSADFEYSGWLTEANHLGNVAYRVGKRLEWNAGSMKARNAPEADRYVRRECRKGWEL